MDYYDDDLFDELSDELAHLPIDGQLAAVLEHITNPSLRHRRTAVKLLSLLSGALSKSTAATLLGMLEQSADAAQNEWGVRSSVLASLALHQPHAIAPLAPRIVAMLQSSDWGLRHVALEALELLHQDALRTVCVDLLAVLPQLEWDLQQGVIRRLRTLFSGSFAPSLPDATLSPLLASLPAHAAKTLGPLCEDPAAAKAKPPPRAPSPLWESEYAGNGYSLESPL